MRKLILVLLLLALPAVGWADEYVLVMSKADNVCQQMLKIYNEDLKKHGEIKYDEHEEFTAIKWEGRKYYTTYPDGKKSYMEDYASIAWFDINNDGQEEVIVKFIYGLKGKPADSLYFFKKEYSDYFKDEFDVKGLYLKAIGKMGTMAFDGNAYDLKELPKVSLGKILGKETEGYQVLAGWFYINPFNFNGSYYINMRDEYPSGIKKFLVTLKYTKENKLKDICYYLKVSDIKTNIQRRK